MTLDPMLYQLGESGRSSAVNSVMSSFSGIETWGDSSSSRALFLPFREYPKASPAPVMSSSTFSRSSLQLATSCFSTPGGSWLMAADVRPYSVPRH